jgi:hypothetical protein
MESAEFGSRFQPSNLVLCCDVAVHLSKLVVEKKRMIEVLFHTRSKESD